MSTKRLNPVLDAALINIKSIFRPKLIRTYTDLKKHCAESRFETAGLAVGKFCEVTLRFLQDRILGSFTPFGTKIENYADECRTLITATAKTANESEKIVIPRALVFLYTMRNKRGIGHVGGDVDANAIDISTVTRIADWIICELIRINHGLSLEEAQDLIDSISVRTLPVVWRVSGKRCVLAEGVEVRDQVLLLLYEEQSSAVLLEDLCDWVEYSNPTIFRKTVVGALHKNRFLEFEMESESIILSPKGVKYVEEHLLKKILIVPN